MQKLGLWPGLTTLSCITLSRRSILLFLGDGLFSPFSIFWWPVTLISRDCPTKAQEVTRPWIFCFICFMTWNQVCIVQPWHFIHLYIKTTCKTACKEPIVFYPHTSPFSSNLSEVSSRGTLYSGTVQSFMKTRLVQARKLLCHYDKEIKLQPDFMLTGFYTYPYVCFCSNKFATIQVDHFWCSVG